MARFLLRLFISLSIFAYSLVAQTGASPEVRVWVSAADHSSLLAESKVKISKTSPTDTESSIRIWPEKRRQQMAGFGASLTESSAHLINFLPMASREKLMRELFDPQTGLGISILRQPMGATDFSLNLRTYDDTPLNVDDWNLSQFTIAQDQALIIPLLKKALEINPELKIIASPWSPPAWMKTGKSLLGKSGGVLRADCYQVYADYFVKFIQAYQAEGIPIYAITPQNEIDYNPDKYPGMQWPVSSETEFVSGYLGPALRKAKLDTQILVWDHNWDRPDGARQLLRDKVLSDWVRGTAWHWYAGDPGAMTQIHNEFPNKEIWHTEGSSGTWIGRGDFRDNFAFGMRKSLEIVNNWSRSLIYWNIALNQNNGPIVFPNTANIGLVKVFETSGSFSKPYQPSFYTLAHFSKFIKPGAWFIESRSPNLSVTQACFINPDQSFVLVLFNNSEVTQTIGVEFSEGSFEIQLGGNSAATCVW